MCRSSFNPVSSGKIKNSTNAMLMGIEADSTHSKVNVSVAINGVKANTFLRHGLYNESHE